MEFANFDKQGNGLISKSDFLDTIKKVEPELKEDEINEMFKEIDVHRNNKINYSEFMIAAINVQKYLTEERMKALFK